MTVLPPNRPARDAPSGAVEAMSTADFTRVVALVNELTGIVLREHKRAMIFSRLSRRLRATRTPSISAYLDRIEDGKDLAERTAFINAVTTNLTSFFREDHHFDDLAKEVLAPWDPSGGPLRLWSAGASTGEEVYSAAMTIGDVAAARGRRIDAKLLATDIDTNVLATGRAGHYGADRLERLSPARVSRHFTCLPDGQFAVTPALRGMVTFLPLNLLGPWPMRKAFHVIFCRNVLIYFDAPTKEALIDRFAAALAPGGTLYLGHSESLLRDHPLLQSKGRTIYRRRAE